MRARSLADRHTFYASLAANTFEFLRVGASIQHGDVWSGIHTPPHILQFEFTHGKGRQRHAYNIASIERVYREKRALLAEHAGFSDFFVPVRDRERVEAVLVTGPFAVRRPTSTDILERWRWLTGLQGHPSDPEFSHYLSMTLGVLTLLGDQVARYKKFLSCIARLIAEEGDAHTIGAEAAALAAKLEEARTAERTWEAVRTMVDPRTSSRWLGPNARQDLAIVGLSRLPELVLVGLTERWEEGADAIDELLRRDAFQRVCVDIARASGDVVCGRIGDHGVVFLTGGATAPARAKLLQIGQRASAAARRQFRFSLHLGIGSPGGPPTLGERYEQALGAAEQALSQGLPLAKLEVHKGRPMSPVRRLRHDLGGVAEQNPEALIATFERYLEAVGARCGYQFELARAHLETGFDEATRASRATGALPEKGYLDMCEALELAARDAATVSELFSAYRRAISDLVDLAQNPVRAAQDRNLRRAITFIHQHFTEPVQSSQVAKISGFAPAYFCQLFKRRERMTFEQYLKGLRVERAKQLLASTHLSAERVGQLSGFTLRPYFHRAFKSSVGLTPLEYRRRGHESGRIHRNEK